MKTLKNIALLALGLGLAINLSSCEKEEDIKDPPVNNDPLKEYTLIGEKDFPQGALSAKLYLKEDPFVGV
ncbi:MAG: hypothetical protein U5L96_14590 [Owenweeksia sp.]|nr:hypothetical protein [Owenweeksia sp.]